MIFELSVDISHKLQDITIIETQEHHSIENYL